MSNEYSLVATKLVAESYKRLHHAVYFEYRNPLGGRRYPVFGILSPNNNIVRSMSRKLGIIEPTLIDEKNDCVRFMFETDAIMFFLAFS